MFLYPFPNRESSAASEAAVNAGPGTGGRKLAPVPDGPVTRDILSIVVPLPLERLGRDINLAEVPGPVSAGFRSVTYRAIGRGRGDWHSLHSHGSARIMPCGRLICPVAKAAVRPGFGPIWRRGVSGIVIRMGRKTPAGRGNVAGTCKPAEKCSFSRVSLGGPFSLRRVCL